MNLIDICILAVVAGMIALVGRYIRRAKKKGVQCIGCPDSRTCSGSCTGCPGATAAPQCPCKGSCLN